MPNRSPNAASSPRDDWWWIFDPRYSLRARAALLVGGGTVLFTVFMAWFAAMLLQRQIQSQLFFTHESLAAQLSDKVDRTIYERYRELQFIATLAPFTQAGVEPAERRRVLESLQTSSRDFAWIGFADAAGHLVSATQKTFEGSVVSDRPWFRIGRERAHAESVHDVTLPSLRAGGEPARARVLDLAVPVVSTNGQFLGVLSAQVNWDWANDVGLSVVPEAARRDLLGATIYSATQEVLLDAGSSGWTLPAPAPALSDARQVRGAMLEVTPEGARYVTGFARNRGFREYRGLGWVTTVRQPSERAFAPVRELRQRIVGWGLIFAGTLTVTSWFGIAQISRRMRGIAVAAERIREGDILTVLPRPRGELDFERMCNSLGNLVEDLRAKDKKPDAPEPAPSAPQSGTYVKPTGTDPRRVIW
ncbi:MAG TPA: cache domain-containing protein [Opitutaceae bacterium]|nr:cache domain-containing protein [Opitutaceae bacterium]